MPARRVVRHAAAALRQSGGLPYSSASNDVVQAQPGPGSCHAIGTGLYERPDPACTPGALNPAVRQQTVDETICVDGWTDSVRPAESVTEQEKSASTAAYGDTAALGGYEYDHFVPLELGGATNDPRNLWPEPGASPNPKDAVEDELRARVCDGQMSLSQAQQEIVSNWVALARPSSTSPPLARPSSTSPPLARSSSTSPRPTSTASPSVSPYCTANASYDARYHDYDVYVRSNQPDQTVTVSDPEGHSSSWQTDSTGYADVYFKASTDAAGQRVTVRVGPASCATTL